MKKFMRTIVGIAILAAGGLFVAIMVATKPEAKKKSDVTPLPVVEFLEVQLEDVAITVPSQGMVEAARTTSLASVVGGKVVKVSDKFDVGGRFEKDEILLEIDDADYKAALARAEASLAKAELELATEKTRSEQALKDWKKLGGGDEPGELVLRKPQLAATVASIESAKADVEKAKRDLERTKVRAPFSGTIEMIKTEIGNYIAPGGPIVDMFENAPFEIRLPVSLDDARFVKSENGDLTGDVAINSSGRGWNAKIIRTEGKIDRMSRSMHLVAEIGGPVDGGGTGALPIQPGLFVQAAISGRTVTNVAKVPFPAFLDLNRVVIIDPDNKLRFREVEILRREGDIVIVSSGLKEGERVCLTELADMIEGREVAPTETGLTPELTDVPEAETGKEVKP